MSAWKTAFVGGLGVLLAACASQPVPSSAQGAAPADPIAALRPYYETIRDLPVAPAGAPLPAQSQRLTRIAFGSCQTAEKPIPILDKVAAARPDLMVYMGDNVYGDAWAGDMSLPELRRQYSLLGMREEFRRLRTAVPMVATWDDHDYGLNDAGVDFSARDLAKRVFASFWGVGERIAGREGVYDAYAFGPAGQRVQVILLDTRFGRTPLSRLPERGPKGPYAQSEDAAQRMLSDAQWAWLEQKLAEPADIRFVVSSIQVLADDHNYEAWRTMPREQARLFATIGRSNAKGVVLVSGDRHIAGLYRQSGIAAYPVHELTTSSLNLSFRTSSDEKSKSQLGDMFAPVNFGLADIDWSGRKLALKVMDGESAPARAVEIPFADLGL